MATVVIDCPGLPITKNIDRSISNNLEVGTLSVPIPAHTYTAASYLASYSTVDTHTSGPTPDGRFGLFQQPSEYPFFGGADVYWPDYTPPVSKTLEVPELSSSGILAQINAAAGGNLPVTLCVFGGSVFGVQITVTLLRLTLTYNGGGGDQAITVPGITSGEVFPPNVTVINLGLSASYRATWTRVSHPHTNRLFQFGTITFPNGYMPGININEAYGGLGRTEFCSVHPRALIRANILGDVLRCYATDGTELPENSPLVQKVDVWRIGF